MGSIRIDGMTTTLGELPPDLDACHQLIRELLESLAEQTHLNEKLQHQLEQLLRQRYGRKTETIDPAQLLLFAREILAASEPRSGNLPTDTPPAGSAEPSQEEWAWRKPLPASLPRSESPRRPPEQLPCPTAAPADEDRRGNPRATQYYRPADRDSTRAAQVRVQVL
jgi:hypothetical protein